MPRPLFLYGTMRAMPILAWLLTEDSRNTDIVLRLVKPAHIKGYARFTVLGKDYPAVIKHNESSTVDGLLLRTPDKSHRQAIEGETYTVAPVQVKVDGEEELVDADVYVWNGPLDEVSEEH